MMLKGVGVKHYALTVAPVSTLYLAMVLLTVNSLPGVPSFVDIPCA